MNINFSIRDAVFFEFDGEALDARELVGIEFRPGALSSLQMIWSARSSNRQLQIMFSPVHDLIIRGRDEEYPMQSGATLGIAGFSNGDPDLSEPELYLDSALLMDYMTFVMEDRSAFAIKADTATMRWL